MFCKNKEIRKQVAGWSYVIWEEFITNDSEQVESKYISDLFDSYYAITEREIDSSKEFYAFIYRTKVL